MSKPSLEERVKLFNSLSLPGQPMMMHMGTSYLVKDLWDEVERLRKLVPQTSESDNWGSMSSGMNDD